MIYLIYGTETFLITKEIEKIKKSLKIDDYNTSTYDLSDTLIENIVDDASFLSLFGDHKLIIVNNADIFTGTTKKELNHNIKVLEDYINNQNPSTIVIFTTNNEKLDERKKIVKLIKEKGKVINYNKSDNVNSYIKAMTDEYKIDSSVISLLINRVGNDLSLLNNEIEKIKTFKDDNKEITKEDIINLTTENIDLDIFKFIDNIISKRKKQALNTYYELIKINEEPIKIIVMLANQIRIMYQTKELSYQGHSEKEIADILTIHPYRVKIALQNAYNYKSETLLGYLYHLSKLDQNIKMGLLNKEIALELFIATL